MPPAARHPGSRTNPSPSPHPGRAIVVGSGIAGLTAALRLQQAGIEVTVLERADHVGGRMICTRRDGFTINRASGIIPASYGQLRALIDELGLAAETTLVRTKLAIPLHGRTYRLRSSGAGLIVDALRTGLLAPASKLRMVRLLRDAFHARRALTYGPAGGLAELDAESAADYCRRRLDETILERVVEPVARGMFLVGPEHVSVADLFFMVLRILGRPQLRYEGGIDFIVAAIAARLDITTAATVQIVERHADGVLVRWQADGLEHDEHVDGCVLAVTGRDVPEVHPGLTEQQREFLGRRTQWSDSIVAHFALRERPPETALLTAIPRSESDALGLVVFHDLVAPDCSPPGRGLVSGYWMHDWSTSHLSVPDDELQPLLVAEMERFVPGIGDLVDFTLIDRWQPVVMRCDHGLYRDLAAFIASLDPTDRIQLAGDFFGYGSTNRCSLTGEQAAQRLTRSLAAASRRPDPGQGRRSRCSRIGSPSEGVGPVP